MSIIDEYTATVSGLGLRKEHLRKIDVQRRVSKRNFKNDLIPSLHSCVVFNGQKKKRKKKETGRG